MPHCKSLRGFSFVHSDSWFWRESFVGGSLKRNPILLGVDFKLYRADPSNKASACIDHSHTYLLQPYRNLFQNYYLHVKAISACSKHAYRPVDISLKDRLIVCKVRFYAENCFIFLNMKTMHNNYCCVSLILLIRSTLACNDSPLSVNQHR